MSEKVMEQGENLVGSDTWCGKLVQELYDIIIPVMVDTELRGEKKRLYFLGIFRQFPLYREFPIWFGY